MIPQGSAKTNPFPNTEKTSETGPESSSKRGKTLWARTFSLRLAQASLFFLCGKLLKTQACRKHTSLCKCCVSLTWIKAMRNGLSKQALGSDSMEQLEQKQISVFKAKAAQTVTLTSHSLCFPELKQYENLRETGKDVRLCVCMLIWGKIRGTLWSCTGKTARTHTVVCFVKSPYRQSKHLQMDFGLKFTCCCQPEKFTPKIRLTVNALLASQWKQMHFYVLQILK